MRATGVVANVISYTDRANISLAIIPAFRILAKVTLQRPNKLFCKISKHLLILSG